MSASEDHSDVVRAQLESLDDTDAHATAWADAIAAAAASDSGRPPAWGGRGRGGRGLSRRTYQPHDVVVDGVTLEFVGDSAVVTARSGEARGRSRILLEGATLKLLPGRTYSLVGRNGCGKSTLLKRMASGRIPGFPPHVITQLVSQELFGHEDRNPLDVVLENYRAVRRRTAKANEVRIAALEARLDALDMEFEEGQEQMEDLCEEISELEGDSDENGDGDGRSEERAREALHFFGVDASLYSTPTAQLSGGIRKKVELTCALFSRPNLLLLDEPTNHQDILGILRLRTLIADLADAGSIVVLVSHDIDLNNDVATDTIHFQGEKLHYYPGNYHEFLKYREQGITHELRQANALERQRQAMEKSIDNLKAKKARSTTRAGKKKIGRNIESKKKKLDRHGIEKDDRGHRWTSQNAGSGIRDGAINGVDSSTRNRLTQKALLKRAEVDIGPVPDKAVQFHFRNTTVTWGDEPLVMIMDVGHSYSNVDNGDGDDDDEEGSQGNGDKGNGEKLVFDCVDLCIREGSRTFILGENGAGKSTLLNIVAGEMDPMAGTVHFSPGLSIGYFHQHIADELIGAAVTEDIVTPLSLLSDIFPKKNEQDLRGELTAFGLGPQQACTNAKFLSGGERSRLCMAAMMLRDPQLIILDEISNHLDVESVEALIYGIREWNGTVIMASHDANLIRRIGGECHVLVEGDGTLLRRLNGGIDAYLKSFGSPA